MNRGDMLNWLGAAEVAMLPHPMDLPANTLNDIRALIQASRWRSVKDELPEDRPNVPQDYLIIGYNKDIYPAYFSEGFFWVDSVGYGGLESIKQPATHWCFMLQLLELRE